MDIQKVCWKTQKVSNLPAVYTNQVKCDIYQEHETHYPESLTFNIKVRCIFKEYSYF